MDYVCGECVMVFPLQDATRVLCRPNHAILNKDNPMCDTMKPWAEAVAAIAERTTDNDSE